jgi:hypothetical protein
VVGKKHLTQAWWSGCVFAIGLVITAENLWEHFPFGALVGIVVLVFGLFLIPNEVGGAGTE